MAGSDAKLKVQCVEHGQILSCSRFFGYLFGKIVLKIVLIMTNGP